MTDTKRLDPLPPQSGDPVPEVTYTLDARDRLEAMGGDWERFAMLNGGEHLVAPGVMGRPIWDFLGGEAVKVVYRALYHQARERKEEVHVPFRCDSPEEIRELELIIEPREDGGLNVISRTLRVKPRQEAVRLLEAHAPRSRELLSMCAWCKQVHLEGSWWDLDDAVAEFRFLDTPPLPSVTHGICPTCATAVMGS